jgi:hypothetical protein
MKKFLILLFSVVLVLSSCFKDTPEKQLKPMPIPGIVYFAPNDTAHFADIALLVTDTLRVQIYRAYNFNYKTKYCTKVQFDSILKSKPYVLKEYKILYDLDSTWNTSDLTFSVVDSNQAKDWLATTQQFFLKDYKRLNQERYGYVLVPTGEEQYYREKLLLHPWLIKSASLVYGTIRQPTK